MSDTRTVLPKLKGIFGEGWDAMVSPAFDTEHSAANWLTRSTGIFGGKTPLQVWQSGDAGQRSVEAVTERFDGMRIG